MSTLTASLSQIFDYGSKIGSAGRRHVAVNFNDRVIIAHPDAALVSWNASGNANPVPGLPLSEAQFVGVNVFQGILIGWFGSKLKYSDQNDFTMWIPVSTTASSFVFALTKPFTLGAPLLQSGTLYVDKDPTGLVVGQFLRIDSDPTYTFFKVASVLPATGSNGSIAGLNQSIAVGATADLFLTTFNAYLKDAQLYFDGQPSGILQVQADAVQPSAFALVLSAGFTRPAIGSTVTVTTLSTPNVTAQTYVSVGGSLFNGQDVYKVVNVNNHGNALTLQYTGVSTSSVSTHQAGEFIVAQPYVTVTNIGTTTATGNFILALKELYGFSVAPQMLTGASATGSVYPVGTQVFTVDANSAGETNNIGATINGPICSVITLGDYGYILKRRSIQSIQYVGSDNGTFFIRPEVTDEGLIGNYSFVKVAEDTVYIWGNKEIYRFIGGGQLVPIAQQYVKQAMAELNLARSNEIIGYHNERDFEVWFVYPRIDQPNNSSLRVLIYNYKENSCSIDNYTVSMGGVTAVGRGDISTDLAYQDVVGTYQSPTSFSSLASYNDEAANANLGQSLIGFKNGVPPFPVTITPTQARDMYFTAYPTTRYISDPITFINWLNAQWGNAFWPPLSSIEHTSPVDYKILKAMGYLPAVGIDPFFLGQGTDVSYGIGVLSPELPERFGDPFVCVYESVDLDAGDPVAYKYADTIILSIQIKSRSSTLMPLLVQLGAKKNYDDNITWSPISSIQVQGNENYTTKVNIPMAGKYFRVRLRATSYDMVFRISRIRILGRKGGTY